MKAVKKTKKKAQKKAGLPQHYSSITAMPLANWFRIEETNDLGHLLKFYRKVTKPAERIALYAVWQKITDEFIEAFGVTDEYRKIMMLRMQIRIAEIEHAITDDGIYLTEKSIYEHQLQELTGKRDKSDHDTGVILASKYMGYHIDKCKITVKEFYTILRLMEKQAAKSKES